MTAIADKLGIEFALIHRERKRRPLNGQMIEDGEETMEVLVGDIDGKVAVLVDDMVDTGNTLSLAAHTLARKGAKAVYALISHGMLFINPGGPLTEAYHHRLTLRRERRQDRRVAHRAPCGDEHRSPRQSCRSLSQARRSRCQFDYCRIDSTHT